MEHNQMSPELQAKISDAESLEDVVRICAEEGITVSKEQLEALEASTADGELSEDALDGVAGGIMAGWIFWYWWRNRNRKRSGGGGGR